MIEEPWYIAICRDCDAAGDSLLPLPFETKADRDDWIGKHYEATRHRIISGIEAKAGADPRELGGDIIGGTPQGQGDALVDTTRAVLLDGSSVVQMTNPSDGREIIGLMLEGRLNRQTERARVLFLLEPDGAAAVVSELVALARRGNDKGAEFDRLLADRLQKLHEEGAL